MCVCIYIYIYTCILYTWCECVCVGVYVCVDNSACVGIRSKDVYMICVVMSLTEEKALDENMSRYDTVLSCK